MSFKNARILIFFFFEKWKGDYFWRTNKDFKAIFSKLQIRFFFLIFFLKDNHEFLLFSKRLLGTTEILCFIRISIFGPSENKSQKLFEWFFRDLKGSFSKTQIGFLIIFFSRTIMGFYFFLKDYWGFCPLKDFFSENLL